MYQNNSYCSHLVEHCVFSQYQSENNFFDIDSEADGNSLLCYTIFSLPDYKDIDKFISHITMPLDPSIISKEKRIIKEELEDWNSTGNLLKNNIWKKLYWLDFKRYPRSSRISNNEIIKYHITHYQKNNIWILDDDFKIINRPSQAFDTYKWDISYVLDKFAIKVQKKDFSVSLFDYTSLYTYTLCYFLEWLYDLFAIYQYRYLGETYYPPICHFLDFPDKLAFVRRSEYKLNIDNDFFIKAKKQFLKNPLNINEILAVNEILKLEIWTQDDVKKIIEWFNYDFIKDFL